MSFTRISLIASLSAIALCADVHGQVPTVQPSTTLGPPQNAGTLGGPQPVVVTNPVVVTPPIVNNTPLPSSSAPLPLTKLPPSRIPQGQPQTQPVAQPPLITSSAQDGGVAPVRRNRIGQTVLSPRISSVTRVGNSMPHMLTGVGLITGLAKTGSADRGTRQAILNYIKQHDLNLSITDVEGGTTALVALTCQLPPFAKAGMRLDVKAEILSSAESLRGGHLMRAVLKGVDGKAYVVAQGALTVAGFTVSGQNAGVSKNPNASGHVLNGGLVIEEEDTSFFSESGSLELTLMNPSPFNSSSVAAGASTALAGMGISVKAIDPSLVRIDLPAQQRTNEYAMKVLGLIGNVRVAIENPTKVTIDQVSGTVLAGEGVLISPCVVQVSTLTVSIINEDFVSQPNPLSDGTTERVGRSRVSAEEESSEMQRLGGNGATVGDLLQNLKAIGLDASQLVSVFTALDQGGFLHAELEVR